MQWCTDLHLAHSINYGCRVALDEGVSFGIGTPVCLDNDLQHAGDASTSSFRHMSTAHEAMQPVAACR